LSKLISNENILFIEGGTLNLKWDNVLKKIRQDPEKFIYEEGGWGAFFDDMDEGDQESLDSDDSEFASDVEDDEEDEDDSEFDEDDLVDEDEELDDLEDEDEDDDLDEGKLIR